ncbi:MAG: winged helix-turn-helix transcriptional regulator [SAR202 cluster bacterium]|nr:winged helix-turn-helix transcriptional regulator [SAR202 cluster bacterium]
MTTWRFLTNHGLVFLHKVTRPDDTVRQIAKDLRVTERAVHRILKDLEDEGYLTKERVGRRAYYKANLLHASQGGETIAHADLKRLLDMLSKGSQRKVAAKTAPAPPAATPVSGTTMPLPEHPAPVAAPAAEAPVQASKDTPEKAPVG